MIDRDDDEAKPRKKLEKGDNQFDSDVDDDRWIECHQFVSRSNRGCVVEILDE